MHSTERPQFCKLVETLLAGFNTPVTEARMDAYWRGCNGMHLLAFERTVDFVLGPEGEDDLPTPKQMHYMHRRMLSARRAAAAAATPDKPEGPERDIFDRYCQRVLFHFLHGMARRTGSAATDESLAAMIDCKNRFVAGYREMCAEEPEASLDLRDALIDALTPLWAAKVTDNTPQHHRDDTWQRLGVIGLRAM